MSLRKTFISILYPLNETLESEYVDRQLALLTAPLMGALAIASLSTWGLIFSIWLRSEVTPAIWTLGIIFQSWLVFCFYALKSSKKIRYMTAYLTPVIPAVFTFIFQYYIVPIYPTRELMIQAQSLPLIMMLCFYAFETISLKLALLSGMAISVAMIFVRPTSLKLMGMDGFYFIVHIAITNIAGILMCVFGSYTARMQFKSSKVAEKEREISDSLIKRVFPDIIGQELRSRGSNVARTYQNVTVLLADLANFTRITKTMDPKQLVTILHELFHKFDRLADQHGVEKIKTIGDAYMAVTGCPTLSASHAQRMGHFALELQSAMRSFNQTHKTEFKIRIGINSGSVVGGVISGKRISFDIWGETVNLASRLQTVAEPEEIIIGESTTKLLRGDFVISDFRVVDLKGIGPAPLARLISSQVKNPFLNNQPKPGSAVSAEELAFLSQH